MIPGETVMSSVQHGIPVDKHLSKMQVLQSGAGYYIGTIWSTCSDPSCKDPECIEAIQRNRSFSQPGSRESEYFKSREEAQAALDGWGRGELTRIRR